MTDNIEPDFTDLEALENEILQAGAEVAIEPKAAEINVPAQEQEQKQDPSVNAEAPARQSKSKKQALIDDITKLYDAMKKPCPMSLAKMKKTKNTELEELLARAVTESTKQVAEQKVVEKQVEAKNEVNSTAAASALYALNKTIIVALEKTSMMFQDKIGTSLEGWSADVDLERKELERILLLIYLDNQEVLETYLSPACQWTIFMIRTAGTRAATNIKKKSETSDKQ